MSQEEHKNSFLAGLSFGLVGGALGYFLFATEKGESLRKNINNKWQEAAEQLQETGIINDSKQSIRQLIVSILDQVETEQQKKLMAKTKIKSKTQTKKPKSKKAKSSKPKKKKRIIRAKKKLKFKGV